MEKDKGMTMRTIILIALALLAPVAAMAGYKDQFRDQNAFATKVDEMPSRNQLRMDYTGTTSGHPIYIGHAAPGIATSASNWRVCKYTDTADGPTVKVCADDVNWDDRATHTYS